MTKYWPHPIKAVIFDNDGTILDTLGIYRQVFKELIKHPLPNELARAVNGLSDIEASKKFVAYFNLDITPQEFNHRRTERLSEILPQCKTMPGVERIIKKISEMGKPMGVATSSTRKSHMVKIMNHTDIFSLFKCDRCGDEVTNAKPAPEIFQKVAACLGDFKPENVLVFEDAYLGIKAANNAGMPSVLLHVNDEDVNMGLDEVEAKPSVIINSFDQFDFNMFNWA